jgi:hypothetical protein
MAEQKKVSKGAIVLSSDLLEKFDISFGAEIAEFSTEFATAFQARSKSGSGEYYALVFKNSFSADLDKMSILREIKDPLIQTLHDFGKVSISQNSQNLCAVMEKPQGIRLSQILAQRSGGLEETLIFSHILEQLSAAISTLHNSNIMHGRINPDNVFFNSKNGAIKLSECISTYSGFDQYTSFETYERMVCHKAGKSFDELEADYYALGTTLCSLMAGEHIFKGIPDKIVQRIKLENGSFDGIYSMASSKTELKISPRNENLIRGLLNDRGSDRWGAIQLKKWKKREISSPSNSRVHRQSSSAFKFGDVEYFSQKYLAFVIAENWSVAKKNIKMGELSRWMAFSSRLNDIETKLYNMTSVGREQIVIPDEKLARILCLMDDGGPFRYKDATFHPIALGNLMAYLNVNPDENLTDNIITALDFGLIESWVGSQYEPRKFKSTNLGYDPRKIRLYARKKEIGFGVERILYETTKYLPCQSPILNDQYSVGLNALLFNLDKKRLVYNEVNQVDNHICAAICKYLDIEDSIRVKKLQGFASIAKLSEVKYCALFAIAQKKTDMRKLPNLTKWIRGGLEAVASQLSSVKIKKNFNDELDKVVPDGDVNKLFDIVTNAKIVKNDKFGFKQAKQQYRILNFEITKLKSQRNMDHLAYRLGLRISVIFSYLVCIISALTLAVLNF